MTAETFRMIPEYSRKALAKIFRIFLYKRACLVYNNKVKFFQDTGQNDFMKKR